MALRGNLKDFSLPDVFQLVTFSRKTGVLRIKREDGAEGSVWFRDGDVFFAQSNWHAEPLGERLVRAQRITEQALDKALEMRRTEGEDGRRLGTILVDEGYITEKVLETFVQDQIQDTIFDLMRWDEGDFDFETMPEVVEEDIGLTVSIENIVMEGSRRLEEWTRIKKKIPSMDVVFKMATAPGEGTFEISLKPMEWQLLLLVDSTRSVADLANETGRTDFEVARIIYGLFSAGLLEFATDEEVEHSRAERAEREAKLAEIEMKRRAELEQKQAAEARKAAELAAKAEAEAQAAKARAEEQAARERAEEAAKAEADARAAADAQAAAEAEERAAAEAQEKAAAEEQAAQAAAEAAATPEVRVPAEEPSFLGGGVTGQSAEDAAVLEEFMGAVLQKPSPKKSEQEPMPAVESGVDESATPEAPAAPYVPVEEPAFMAVEHEETSEPGIAIPSVEDIIPGLTAQQPVPVPGFEEPAEPQEQESGPQPLDLEAAQGDALGAFPDILVPSDGYVPEAETVRATPEPAEAAPAAESLIPAPPIAAEPAAEVEFAEVEPELEPAAEIELQPEPEVAREPLPEPEPEPEPEPVVEVHSFENDLRSLGLGELPTDLLGLAEEPAAEEPAAEEPPSITIVPEEEPFELLPVSEPMSALPESEISYVELEPEEVEEEPDDIARLQAELDLPAEMPSEEAPTSADEEPDFSELLLSLDVDGETETVTPQASGFDEELLREEPAETGGVISTDAFLGDIGEIDMGGSLNDELSALTGLNRPARPQASVNKIPEAGSAVLRRDTRVDKDTLLKIIDGIQNL